MPFRLVVLNCRFRSKNMTRGQDHGSDHVLSSCREWSYVSGMVSRSNEKVE